MKSLPFSSTDCLFYCDDSETTIFKCCKNRKLFDQYQKRFYLEYQFMKKLEDNSSTPFFPHYDKYGTNIDQQPYISLEYIHSDTLEKFLCQKEMSPVNGPQFLFSIEQLSHICRQVYDALSLLAKNGILYFDLNPCNILFVNPECDIRLIDFTSCYYLHLGEKNYTPRFIDTRGQEKLPLSLKLVNAMQLFFTRLFYCGQEHYNTCFHPCGFDENLTQSFFQKHFGFLLSMVINPEKEYLSYLIQEAQGLENQVNCNYLYFLDDWHSRLQNHFRAELEKLSF